MAAAVKKAVSVPVIAVCNIKEPNTAESLLQRGVCDFVGVGRGHLADPRWCAKAFAGRADEIRKCIGCLACFGEIVKCRCVKCAVNPATGRERDFARPVKNGAGRPVAVIGGGPAGIEAALTLKERGFAPVIFDEAERLGGALNTADKGVGKDKITRCVESLAKLVEAAGIETRLGRRAEPSCAAAISPCGVFVACGAEPLIPDIPGINNKNVVTAEDVLNGRAAPQEAVIVIGSGMTGLETAETLIAAGCSVTIAEMQDTVGPGMYAPIVDDVMSRITPGGARILTGHRLLRITEAGAELKRLSDGENVFVKASCIVLAMGVRPRKETAETFKAAFDNVVVIGDARRGGRILEATQDARGRAFVFMAEEN